MKTLRLAIPMTLFSILTVLYCSAFAGSLHDAAKSGDISLTKQLIDKGTVIDEGDQYGATPLYWAAFKGHANVAELLIARGAKVNTKNMIGDTPLHGAMASCSLAVTKLLLEKGANVNEPRKEGTSPLHIAVERCNMTMVELLISKGAKIDPQISHGQMSGQTPLYRAAGKNLLEIAAFLLSKGANPNIPNKDGDTPLHVAAGYCQFFCVNFSKANSLRKGRLLRTFPIGFDLQCNSIFRQIKARSV